MPTKRVNLLDPQNQADIAMEQDRLRRGRYGPPQLPGPPPPMGMPAIAFAQEPPPLPDQNAPGMDTVPMEGMGGPPEYGDTDPAFPGEDDVSEALAASQQQQRGGQVGGQVADEGIAGNQGVLENRGQVGGQEGGFDKAGLMRGLASLGDTMGSQDWTPHARLGVFGIKVPGQRPTPKSPLHGEAARIEDRLSEGERQMLSEAFGIQVPEGSRFSRIAKIAPDIAQAVRYRDGMTAYQREQLELARGRDVRAEARDERSEGYAKRAAEASERQAEAEKRREYLARRLPNDVLEKLSLIDQTESSMEALNGILERGSTGPIEGFWQQLGRLTGHADPEKLKDQAVLQTTVAEFLFGTGGKQLTPQERSILRPALPSRFDQPSALKPLMEAFREVAGRRKEALLNNFERGGYDVSPWRGSQEPNETTTRAEDRSKARTDIQGPATGQAGGGMIEVRLPSGQTGQIHGSRWEEFLRDNPGAQQVR